MKTAMKSFLRLLTACMVLMLLLPMQSHAAGEEIISANDTPRGAYTYFPGGLPQNLVFYFPNALTDEFWQNLPASIYTDYPDGNLPADALEYYRQNLEPLLSAAGGGNPRASEAGVSILSRWASRRFPCLLPQRHEGGILDLLPQQHHHGLRRRAAAQCVELLPAGLPFRAERGSAL